MKIIGFHAARLILAIALISGCASKGELKDERDPWEGYNRAAFKFNDTLDRAILKPVAKGYKKITPDLMEEAVHNFFSNLEDVGVAVNNLLQFKIKDGFSDIGRLALNSTFGIGGLIDLGTVAGFRKHEEDFGQTLGAWGLDSGPYFVIPFLGPSTLRDAPAKAVDHYLDPITYVEDDTIRYSLRAVDLIDLRAGLLATEETIEGVAFDRYTFIKNAFLDRREFLVHDGNPPIEDDFLDELDELDALDEE